MAYADITISDRNPVKRWLQRRRFSDAVSVLTKLQARTALRVLDFGTGDGELAHQIAGVGCAEVWAYEPAAYLMAEARKKLAESGSVVLTETIATVESGLFDYVFCLEVMEHLPQSEALAAIEEIHRLLKPAGAAVIGVPHEIFFPALLKGLFRMSRRYGKFDARPMNVLRAFVGRPPLQRPLGEISPGLNYHFEHLGFDHRALERMLAARFKIEAKWFSPFPMMGTLFNSEVYFLVRKSG